MPNNGSVFLGVDNVSADEVEKYKILTFIGVADSDDEKKWTFDYSRRPDKYVVLSNELSNDPIDNEGITGMTARLQRPTYLKDAQEIAKNKARGIYIQQDDIAKSVHLPCQKLIAIPLFKEVNNCKELAGEIRLDLYDPNKEFSKEFQELAEDNTTWFDNSLFKDINSIVNFLVDIGSQDAKSNSYKELYKGQHLLEGLINIRVKAETGLNKDIFILLFHLYLVFQRYTYVGHADIITRVSYFIKDMCKKANLPSEELEHLLEVFKDHENLMLYDIEHYRDHFMHQFHTFVLGYITINLIGVEKIRDIINTRLKNTQNFKHLELDNDSVIRIWILTSIFHDICYLIEKYNVGIQEFLEKLLKVKIPNFFDWGQIFAEDEYEYAKYLLVFADLFRSTDTTESTNSDKLLSRYFQVIKSKQDHGVFSALLLINCVLQSASTETRRAELYLAGFAISIHNSSIFKCLQVGSCLNVPFDKFPIEFLLAYCDTSQEWGRKGREKQPKDGPCFKNVKLENQTIITSLEYSYRHPEAEKLVEWARNRAATFSAKAPSFKIEYQFPSDQKLDVNFHS